MNYGIYVINEIRAMANEALAQHLMRFFKTGKGKYGEGDKFLGIRIPQIRSIVKEYRKDISLSDIDALLDSQYHEIRLAGFMLLIEIYNRAKKQNDEAKQRNVVNYYLSKIDKGNSWDLVDLPAPKILGDWIARHPEDYPILDQLAAMDGKLWHQRVAMVANWMIIRSGEYSHTFRIAEKLLHHRHDLIHKAVGWMLREVGKHGGRSELIQFLDEHATEMPRTMLRYSIEHFSPEDRKHYMTKTT